MKQGSPSSPICFAQQGAMEREVNFEPQSRDLVPGLILLLVNESLNVSLTALGLHFLPYKIRESHQMMIVKITESPI